MPDDGKHHSLSRRSYTYLALFYFSLPPATSPYVRFFLSTGGKVRLLSSSSLPNGRKGSRLLKSVVSSGSVKLVPQPADSLLWPVEGSFTQVGASLDMQLVVKAISQTEASTGFEAFVPVVQAASLRLLLTIAASNDSFN